MVIKKGDRRTLPLLAENLSAGGIVIMPCDTIYGIVGRVPDTEARIRAAKGRGETNPFLMLIASQLEVERFSNLSIDPRVASLWPGPLTLVVPARHGGTVAVRVPGDKFVLKLLAEVGFPLYSTSANRSGEPPLDKIEKIIAEFESRVDLIVDAGNFTGRKPSTILDVSAKPYRILRQGACEVPDALLK